MRKITQKMVNKGLASLSYLNRYYILRGRTGIIKRYQSTFESAYADLDDGKVYVTTYAYGDAKEFRHFYNKDTTDVTDIIEEFIAHGIDRKLCVKKICERMNESI